MPEGNSDEIDLANFNIEERIKMLEEHADEMWTMLAGYFLFLQIIIRAVIVLMQLGFAFLEGGCVRYKNMQSIMIKVFANAAISIIMTWIVGFGLMFGTNDRTNFLGTDLFAAKGFDEQPHNFSRFVFQTAIAAAANSIVSGGAAERMSFVGYMILSVVFSAWIYPVIIHWAFGNGWLMQMGYHDFAGSGAIHLTGAMGALAVTWLLKPRKNRFNPQYEAEFQPCNTPYITLATLSLWFCWMFFNSGSTEAISGDSIYYLSNAGMNTMIAGSSGALTVFALNYMMTKQYSLVMLCNGNLAGLVSITGSCDNVEAWAAFVIGLIGGIVYIGSAKLVHWCRIDDPVDAVPIHGGCGIVGAMWPGWFDRDRGIFYGKGAYHWGVQVLGCVCFIGWSFGLHVIVLLILKYFDVLRIDEQTEEKGIDYAIGGGPGFFYEAVPQEHTINHEHISQHELQEINVKSNQNEQFSEVANQNPPQILPIQT